MVAWRRSEAFLYLITTALIGVVVTVMLRLWRAHVSVPFFYSGDAVSTAAMMQTTLRTGWYETQPELGAPYGQHYHDFPFSDDLNLLWVKVIGLFSHRVGVVINLYYLLGFFLAAVTALWFFRRCGLGSWLSIALAVLYSVAPYHFFRNENHLFLASYYAVPLAMIMVLSAIRGEALWGRRPGVDPIRSILSGPGAMTVAAVTLVTLGSAYYGVFTAILLGLSGLIALVKFRNWRRLGGVIAAGACLVVVFLAPTIPDVIYRSGHGRDVGAFVRSGPETETYALKFVELILPAPGHPIDFLSHVRELYDTRYPFPGEDPALGLIAAIGFVVLLVLPLLGMARGRIPRSATPAQQRRRLTLNDLSALVWLAFLTGTMGGISTLVSVLVTDSIRGWNRISIFIALLCLAAVGLLAEAVAIPLAGRLRVRWPSARARTLTAAIAVAVLVLGVADQSVKTATPDYPTVAAAWNSDQQFVDRLQATVPTGAMLFQLPYQAFPESVPLNGVNDSDQLRLYLHSTTLRWSGGGIKGRPQTDWPAKISEELPVQMTTDLSTIGFAGIVVDRRTLSDAGHRIRVTLAPVLGAPLLTSPDNRYWYFSLRPVLDRLLLTTTPAQRAARTTTILGGRS